jgi:CRISPR-associated endonuclease/helicase Cas3
MGGFVGILIPGYLTFEGVEGHLLPNFEVQWNDDPDEATRSMRWAAERPKRFLAGTIAVGTIDQALMGAITLKHAHLRAAALSRLLLVVDEVHASDHYMEQLLTHLLRFHRKAGGQALLLSATLGSAARVRFLGLTFDQVPSFDRALVTPYPALSSDKVWEPQLHKPDGYTKEVAMTLCHDIADAPAIARRALAAAEAGAKVLVVRNSRRDAIDVFNALAQIAPEHSALFRCNTVATLHHGRFALEDRRLLDAAVERAIGYVRPKGGLVLVGTQTLEISLDIDADLMITDLCPADVLLQRLGRLHRHSGRRDRAPGFAYPKAIVLSPTAVEGMIPRGRHGLGGENGPYDDLVAVEATRRLVQSRPIWSIPAMNRFIVETVTHPEAQQRLLDELLGHDPRWQSASEKTEGKVFASRGAAARARLRWDKAWTSPEVAFPKDEIVSTRLGLRDLAVTFESKGPIGPFGTRVKHLAIPDYWLRPTKGIAPFDFLGNVIPEQVTEEQGGFRFTLQARHFEYGSRGLSPIVPVSR